MRNAISNQVFGKLNKEQYQIKKFEKTEIQKKKIKEKLLSIFLFNSLNEKELNDIINAFEEKKYKLNEIVFKQGENSENFYLVEQGEFDCEKIYRIGDPQTYIKTFRAGDQFEELALLYNYKNPYSIIAKSENCSLYSLNRDIYNNIIRNYEHKKREKYMKILKQIEILSTLNDSELLKIIDNLTFEIVKEGNKIIKQNENGNKMLIIDEGEAQAIKNIDGKPDQKLNVYNKDSYFCENCLLKNEINPFNIIANKDCNVAIIDRMTFKRLVGPLENLLERDRKIYQKFMK
jgi:cAMP-dependent protein kinase regulator